jgi:hypothetical protein
MNRGQGQRECGAGGLGVFAQEPAADEISPQTVKASSSESSNAELSELKRSISSARSDHPEILAWVADV